jgi:hypothetical protein
MDYVSADDDKNVEDKHILDLFVLYSYDQIFDDKVTNFFDVFLFDYQRQSIDEHDDHVIMTKKNIFIVRLYLDTKQKF